MKRLLRISCVVFFLTIIVIQSCYALTNPPAESSSLAKAPKKPVFHLGLSLGTTSSYGDLVNNNLKMPFYYRYGIQLNVERDICKATRLCLNFFGGNIYGDEKTDGRTLNFKSSLLAPQLGLSFNFLHWANKGKLRNHFATYLFVGAEALFFSTAGDLKNSDNETYYYWNDGSIRNLSESFDSQDKATIIKRDYKYETNYRNLDIDNVGKVPQFGFGVPLGLSAEFKFNNGIAIRAGAVYHYTFTDYLDNITSNSIGNRKGNAATDKFLFTHISVCYSLPIWTGRAVCGTEKMNTHITRKKPKKKFK